MNIYSIDLMFRVCDNFLELIFRAPVGLNIKDVHYNMLRKIKR